MNYVLAPWDPNDSQILVGSRFGDLIRLDVVTGERLASTTLSVQDLIDIACSPDGTRVAVSGSDKTVRILDAVSFEELLLLDQADSTVDRLRWCCDGHVLVGLDTDGRIMVWDARRGYESARQRDLVLTHHYCDVSYAVNGQDDAKAIRSFQSIVDLNPAHTDCLWILGNYYQRAQDFPKAIEAYSKVIEFDPLSDFARSRRAECYASISSWEDAYADYAVFVQRRPTEQHHRYKSALLSAKLHRPADYRDHCGSILEIFGNSHIGEECYMTAWACALIPNGLDDYTNAIAVAQRAVDSSPEAQRYLLGLGAILMRAGDYERSKVELEKAIIASANEKTSRSYVEYFLAMTEFHLGNVDSARQHLLAANVQADKELSDSPPWNRKLTLELLRDEATELIRAD